MSPSTRPTLVLPGGTRIDRPHQAEASYPAPGTIVGGVYRILGRLGAGAMGVVLLAHDESLDRDVAIKLVHPEFLHTNFRDLFLTEARAMARVSHPNVLQIHAFGEHRGAPYFVMELVKGRTLAAWFDEVGPAPDLDLALRILQKTCDGVAAIHAAETIHRDLKPSNILLDANLSPYVADLGLAVLCRADPSTQIGGVGTPDYMAPEMVFPGELNRTMLPRADVYSLACIAYEMFTGRTPFESDGSLATMIQRATIAVPAPSTIRPELPRAIDQALMRALALDPALRTPTVEAFCRELAAARSAWSEPTRILVADDDVDFREVLELTLQSEFPNAEIECTPDGRSALEAFDRKRPSIALFDLAMPGLNGLELTQLIRQRVPSSVTPIIILTASGGPEEWRRLTAMGADRFLVKPVALDDVVALVRRVLSGVASKTASWPPVPIVATRSDSNASEG